MPEVIDISRSDVFRPSKLKHSLMFLLVLGLLFGGMLTVQKDRLMGWITVVVFGLGGILLILLLVPNSSYLRVSSKGLEFRRLWRTWRYRWGDIACFYAGQIGPVKMVMFRYSANEAAKAAGMDAAAVASPQGCFPLMFANPPEALAEYLNEWKALLRQKSGDVASPS